MIDKPTTLPKFAELDQMDPTSGENNVVAPIPTKQNYGWAFKEKPPRQHFNWLHRWTYRWLKWTDDTFKKGIITAQLTTSGAGFSALGTNSEGALISGKIHFTIEYRIFGDIVYLVIPSTALGKGVYGVTADTPPTGLLLESHLTDWPTDLSWVTQQDISAVMINDGEKVPGLVNFDPVSSYNYFPLETQSITATDNKIQTLKFEGGDCGIAGQILSVFNSVAP